LRLIYRSLSDWPTYFCERYVRIFIPSTGVFYEAAIFCCGPLGHKKAAREFSAARRYTAGDSPKRKAPLRGDSVGTAFAKSFARQMGTRAGRAVMRGVLGALTGR